MIHSDFERTVISDQLIKSLGDRLWTGESIVLLGPRRLGKRYVLRKLRERLVQGGRTRVGQVGFLTEDDQDDGSPDQCEVGVARLDPEPRATLRWVDEQLAAGPGIVTLLASNVGLLHKERLLEFLGAIRQRTEGQGVKDGCRLAVALTGEIDLGRAMLPPLSGFACANQYLLYGFDREQFDLITRRYLKVIGRFVEPPTDEELAQIYLRTGGNTHFLRLILWSLFDRRAGDFDSELRPVRIGEDSDEKVAANIRWNSRLRYVLGVVESEPECWGQLEQLIKDREVSCAGTLPHPFELIGIAVRKGDKLVPASTLCETFLRQYYTDRRFADYYAHAGLWHEAFSRYRDIERSRRIRPTTADDVVETADLVKTLRTALYHEALEGPEKVLELFANGCRDLLGFHEVTRWHNGGRWRSQSGGCFDTPGVAPARYFPILDEEPDGPGELGRLRLGDTMAKCVLAARLPGLYPDARDVVIVGLPGEATIISRARTEQCNRLVDELVRAYAYALEAKRVRELLKIREVYTSIVNNIVAKLGADVLSVRQVLEMAAEHLMQAERPVSTGGATSGNDSWKFYKRVIFCLVDPSGARIEAVVERSGDESHAAFQATSYVIHEHTNSGHAWVVLDKKRLVTDAQNDPRTCKEVVNRFDVRGIAIIPMTMPDQEVIGTILVESADGTVPTEDEAGVIEEFAKQLAGVLISAERVEFCRKALDSRIEPIAFFDRLRGELRLRYANKAAEPFLGYCGWIPPVKVPTFEELRAQPLCGPLAEHFAPLIQNALKNRKVSEKPGLVEFPYPEPRGTAHSQIEAVAIPFDDYHEEFEQFRNNTAGVICHVRVMNDLYMTFNAIKSVIKAASREDVITRVVNAMKEMGHVQGRLYLADESGHLVGKLSFGPDGRQPEWFASGPVRLGARDDPDAWESWHAIEERRPVVFVLDPDGNDRDKRLTPEGLEVVVSQSPSSLNHLVRKRGEYWVDLPLLAGDQVVGKLSLDCVAPVSSPDAPVPEAPKAKHPRDLEFLRVFCDLIDVLFQAWDAWSRDVEERIQARKEISEKLAHEALHDGNNRLVPLGFCLTDLRTLEKHDKSPRLKKIGDDLERVIDDFEGFYTSFLLRSLDEAPRFERVELGELFRELAVSKMAQVEVKTPREGSSWTSTGSSSCVRSGSSFRIPANTADSPSTSCA